MEVNGRAELRRVLALLLFVVVGSVAASSFAQDVGSSESERLTARAFAHFRNGMINDAISDATRVVEIERSVSGPPENLAVAIKNQALLQKEHFWILQKIAAEPSTDREVLRVNYEKLRLYRTSIVSLLAEAIELLEKAGKGGSILGADAKFELAWFLYRVPAAGLETSYSKPDAVERLFEDVLETRTRILGETDDATMWAKILFANFYFEQAEFERSLALYRQATAASEKKHPILPTGMLAPLRAQLRILVATDQQGDAVKIRARITKLTGIEEEPPEMDLSGRSKEDYLKKLIDDPRTITHGLKKQKSLLVRVTIDESGKPISVVAADPKEKDMFGNDVQKKASKEVLKWRFRPFIENGIARKMRGVVWFPYLIKP